MTAPAAVSPTVPVAGNARDQRVWDPLVRVLHWTLVAGVAAAWLTEDAQSAHQIIGYIVVGALTLRLLWGVVGTHYARFAQFVHSPAGVWRYARAVRRDAAPRYIGHNPLGGWMVVALLLTLSAIGGTGMLMTSDAFWGEEWLEELHEMLASGLLVLVTAHIGGVIHASRMQRENLVRAMLSGTKPAAQAGDIA